MKGHALGWQMLICVVLLVVGVPVIWFVPLLKLSPAGSAPTLKLVGELLAVSV